MSEESLSFGPSVRPQGTGRALHNVEEGILKTGELMSTIYSQRPSLSLSALLWALRGLSTCLEWVGFPGLWLLVGFHQWEEMRG